MIDFKKQGKSNRAAGKRFELKVREDLEEKGWLVFRNSNDVSDPFETDIGEYSREFKQAKAKWNPFTRSPMTIQSGFPDFLCIQKVEREYVPGIINKPTFFIKFVECKLGKYLDKKEKEKCSWILNKLKIKVFVAYKGEKRGEIKYDEFQG